MNRLRIAGVAVFISLVVSLTGCSKNNDSDPGIGNEVTAGIADLNLPEGNAPVKAFVFEVALSKAATKAVSIGYKTMDGTAKSGEDYTAAEGTVTIQPGDMKGTVSISVLGDDIKEADKSFMVRLSNPVNCFLTRETAVATIANDDTKILISNTGYDAPASYPGYTLRWSEEFNGTALDENSWSFEVGDGCPTLCGWGNNELQYYTRSTDNLYFQDGKMIIEARKQSVGNSNYSSARIKTQGKKTFKFGRIDMRAKLPAGKGIWPAFWMLPQTNAYGSWPKSGEIDIMELLGHEPNKVYGTVHFGPGPGSTQITQNRVLTNGTFSNEFHVFSIDWKQDQIQWLVDGNVFSTAAKPAFGNNNYPFNEEFYLLLNLAVGGQWPGSPDASTSFPQSMIVDYVRVYQ